MGIEGGLTIRLAMVGGAVQRVRIESSRPVHASRVFHGKRMDQSLQMIPLLFSICATAQRGAGVRACEQTLGLRVSPQAEQLRDLLVNMETLREHLWRIQLDWPRFLGRPADASPIAAMNMIQRDYLQALCAGSDPFQPGGAACEADRPALNALAARLSALLQQHVFGVPVAHWLALEDEPALADWAASGTTTAAAFIDQIRQAGWCDSGACDSMALPPLPDDPLHQALQDQTFIEQPTWSGQCCESTSLVRVDTPLLRSLKQQHGNGLLTRLVARLTELALLAQRILPEQNRRCSDHSAPEWRVHDPGIGQVAAARGQLVHRVALAGERIASYQIVAPTEWNFHPRGVVSRALSTLTGDRDRVERLARMLINAIDPCVGYQLHVCREGSIDA